MRVSRPLEPTLPAWGVSVLESHHARDFQTVFAAHSFFQLLFVVRGRGQLLCPPSVPLSLAEGDLALIAPGCSHGLRDKASTPLSIYAVNLSPHFLETLAPLTEVRHLRNESLARTLPDSLRRLLLEQTLGRDGFEAMMSGLALQLLASVWRATSTSAAPIQDGDSSLSRIQALRSELESTFYKKQNVDEVAARLKMSRRAFTSLFRQTTSESFGECVRNIRVGHAKRLLETSDRTVLAIAFECGFEDVSGFHRAFKAVAGTSPDAWRKLVRS